MSQKQCAFKDCKKKIKPIFENAKKEFELVLKSKNE